MIIITLLLSLILNLANRVNIFIGLLNVLLLFLSIYFYFKFTNQKLSLFKFSQYGTPLIILIGAMPLFTGANDILVIIFAIGLCLLAIFYLKTKHRSLSKLIIVIYLIFAVSFANGLIKPPFSFQTNLLIFNDNWTRSYITQMQIESQYMPDAIRSLVFNPSVHFYVILSKVAGFFTLKNFYEALLIANIYSMIKGLIQDFKNWNGLKTFLICLIFLILFGMAVSRSEEISNTFVLLSPIVVYFILRGLNSVNKKIYLALFLIGIFISMGV